jgi:CBS domain-containing protein
VISVVGDELALAAFQRMVEHNVSGLAVLGANGKLIETISIRDLKAIQNDGRMFWRLNQTVVHFLEKIKKDAEEKTKRPRTLVTIKIDDTLEHIITKLVENKVHRIFVVNDDHQPIGVISLKDVLFQVVSHPGL